MPRPRPIVVRETGVKAGEWDDNANYRDFQKYLSNNSGNGAEFADVSKRRFVVVRDNQGKAVPNCQVTVSDTSQNSVRITTMSSGRALLFPNAEGLHGSRLQATSNCLGERKTVRGMKSCDTQHPEQPQPV